MASFLLLESLVVLQFKHSDERNLQIFSGQGDIHMTAIEVMIVVVSLLGLVACGEADQSKQDDEDALPALTDQMIQTKIMDVHCVKCHNAARPAKGIDLSTSDAYAVKMVDIIGSRYSAPLIVPGKPQESSLFLAIADGSMPKKAEKLPDAMIKDMERWILGLKFD